MTPDPVAVGESTPITEVGELMAQKRLKRLPVTDAAGKLRGMISRLDLLRTVAQGAQSSADLPRPAGLRGDAPLARVMRKDVPPVAPDAPLAEGLEAVVAAAMQRARVVDGAERVGG